MATIRAYRERGLNVPGYHSITSIDDIGEVVTGDPPFTTLYRPRQEIGEEAADLLMALVETSGPSNRKVIVQVRLAQRGTTAPPGR